MFFTKDQVNRAFKTGLKGNNCFKGFELLRLKDFLTKYSQEIEYDMNIKRKNKESPYDILCLVDTREDVFHTMSDSRRKNLRKAGGAKRRRIKDKYHYENIFNRIHGYLLLEDQQKNIHIPRDRKVMSLSLICSSYYSNMRGVGTILMKSMIELSKICEYTDIILEVANDYAGSEESDSEDSDEESGEESDEEYEESVNQPLIERLGKEFLRKVVRITENGLAHYSIGDDYIIDIIHSYLEDEYDFDNYDDEFKEVDLDDPGENEYGGYYYHKGRKTQIKLLNYYEKFGFVEDKDVHFKWKSFTTDPFPSMIKHL